LAAELVKISQIGPFKQPIANGKLPNFRSKSLRVFVILSGDWAEELKGPIGAIFARYAF
jgi:hypothetical protein